MNFLDLANWPLSRTLSYFFESFFELPFSSQSLAIQLGQGTALIKEADLRTNVVNEKLAPLGLEMVSGRVSSAQLQILDLSSLKSSIHIGSMTATLRLIDIKRNPYASQTLLQDKSRFSDYVPLKKLLKKFLTKLKVSVGDLTIHIQTRSDLDPVLNLRGVKYENSAEDIVKPAIKIQSISVSDGGKRNCVALDDVWFSLQAAEEGRRLSCEGTADCIDIAIESLFLRRLSQLAEEIKDKFDGHGEDFEEVASVMESVFYDAEESMSAVSSFYSDTGGSVFFDCEEFSESNHSNSISFDFKAHRVRALVAANGISDSSPRIVANLEGIKCISDMKAGINLKIDVDEAKLTDGSRRRLLKSTTNVPALMTSLLRMEEDTVFCQLGFPKMRKRPSLSIEMTNETVIVDSAPIVFWLTCDSIDRFSAVAKSIKKSIGVPNQNSANSRQVDLRWTTNGIFGVVERPVDAQDIPRLLSIDIKTSGDTLLSLTEGIETRRWMDSLPISQKVLHSAIGRLTVHHYECTATSIVDHQCIVDVRPASRSDFIDEVGGLPSNAALSIEITKPNRIRPHGSSDLSTLAYQLVNSYSQSSSSSFSERTISRVEYEGKCVQSADETLEVFFGIINVDLCPDQIESCMDVFLFFWHPSKMADQMKGNKDSQSVVIVNGRCIDGKLRNLGSLSAELRVDDAEVFAVSGVQRKTISTLSATIGRVEVKTPEDACRLRIGEEGDESGIQFLQVSELDLRNAKFKEWAALQLQQSVLEFDRSIVSLSFAFRLIEDLISKNEEKLKTDIEVEAYLYVNSVDSRLQYSNEDQVLRVRTAKCHLAVENFVDGIISITDVDLVSGRAESPTDTLHEESIECKINRTEGSAISAAIRNRSTKIKTTPTDLRNLIELVRSISSLVPSADQGSSSDDEAPPDFMSAINRTAFSVKRQLDMPTPIGAPVVESDECDEDGFVVIDDFDVDRDPLKESNILWTDYSDPKLKDDYITLPQEIGIDESEMQPSHVRWVVKLVDISFEIAFYDPDFSGSIDLKTSGFNVTYSRFLPGSNHDSRLSVSFQEIEIVDNRPEENGRRIAERNRSQLRTICSRRLEQQKTLTFPMIQFTSDTVMPDESQRSKVVEVRFDLRIVPLRLRLSKSFSNFMNLYLSALPPSGKIAQVSFKSLVAGCIESKGGGVYFQMCTVGALFLVVDYRPRPVDLERLRSGRPSELINAIKWEGLEFFLNDIKEAGLTGWSNLLTFIVQNWTRDINSANKYRMVGGIPALGVIKRVSPAAQDVLHAAMHRVAGREAPEATSHGTVVAGTPSLSRAMSEFGRVFSLEVLNLCASGAEGMHLIIDGAGSDPSPANMRSAWSQARQTLKDAAMTTVVEPYQLARSGEGIGVAMSKALWAMPKALLAPASAATAVVHGSLKSACKKLDTDNVLNSNV